MSDELDQTAVEEASQVEEVSAFALWLRQRMDEKDISIGALSEKTGITYTGIRNILVGRTASPRDETRKRLAEGLNEIIPAQVEAEIEQQSTPVPGMEWVDFTPTDLQTVPAVGGVYVFYDVTDRPVYVGKSSKNVRTRVKDHQTRFWFKAPLVVRGAFLAVPDPDLCLKIETILIKFLGKHALLNVKGVSRDED